MNIYVKSLVSLSDVDKEINVASKKTEEIKKNLELLLNKAEHAKDRVENLKLEIKDIKIKIDKNNLNISDFSDKLKNIAQKNSTIKNIKEMKAIQLEEEITKDQLAIANDNLYKMERLISRKERDIAQFEEKHKELSEDLEKEKIDSNKEIELIKASKKSLQEKRDQIVSKINVKILDLYEKIRKWAGDTTIVVVKNQACYGCFMKISDRAYMRVVSGEDIATCPHCGRILYLNLDKEDND